MFEPIERGKGKRKKRIGTRWRYFYKLEESGNVFRWLLPTRVLRRRGAANEISASGQTVVG